MSDSGGSFGSTRNLLALTLVSAVLVLGLWVMTEPSDGTVAGFPAKSCLNAQPSLSPTFALCQEADQRMREHRSGMGIPAGSGGAGDQYQSLIDRVMAAEDTHMAAYLIAVRAYSALEVAGSDRAVRDDANAAIFMLASDNLPGSQRIRDLAHAALGALAIRAGERSAARQHFEQIDKTDKQTISPADSTASSPTEPDHPPSLFIAAATHRLRAEFALRSRDIDMAILQADRASAVYQAIDAPRLASLVQMELAEIATIISANGEATTTASAALTFMSRAVQHACNDDEDPSYCGFVGSWARQLRQDIGAKAG